MDLWDIAFGFIGMMGVNGGEVYFTSGMTLDADEKTVSGGPVW